MAAFTDNKNPITTPAPSYRSTRSLRSTPSYHTTDDEDIEMSPAADIEPAVQINETNASPQATSDHSLFTGLSWLVLFIVAMVLVLVFRPKKSYDCPKLDDRKEYYRTKCGPQHAAFAVAMAIVMGKIGEDAVFEGDPDSGCGCSAAGVRGCGRDDFFEGLGV
ncbi:hypothetical protein LTR15_005133 [Elasticomyces elasticus]|nr:hypothetical protein LTR15_005133 [Elasticomyces elasticus]